MSLHIINRVLFNRFNFRFNYFFLFLQQFFQLIFFKFIAVHFAKFRQEAGEISWADFNKHKWNILIFNPIFIGYCISIFISNQLVKSSATYFCFKRFSLLMNFIYGIIVHGKPFIWYYLITIACVISGSLLTSKDDLDIDLKGVAAVFINNLLLVLYSQATENFKKKSGSSNLKLMVYNSYLSSPILLILSGLTGELNKLYIFIKDNYQKREYTTEFLPILTLVCCLVVVMNSSFMISNEKKSSIYIALVSCCKDVIISVFSAFVMKEFNATPYTFLGLIIGTIGTIIFSFNSLKEAYFKGNNKASNSNNEPEVTKSCKEPEKDYQAIKS